MTYSVTLDIKSFMRGMDEVTKKQLPFAMAKALTNTAQDCQRKLIDDLDEYFTIRNNFVAKGIRTTPARKNKNINDMYSMVGSLEKFMKLQAEGGTKESSGKALGVPTVGPHGTRKTEAAKITQSLRMSNMLKDYKQGGKRTPGKAKRLQPRYKRYFIAPLPNMKARGIWLRTTKKHYPIHLMYIFEHRVRIPKRWPIQEQVRKEVNAVWERNARIALMQALATARK